MVCDVEWITYRGAHTKNNQDYCGVAIRDDHILYCVVDGSSQSDESGSLANEFVKALVDKFVAKSEITSVKLIISLLNELSENFKTSHPAGRLSFLILLYKGDGVITAIHAGDCRLGTIGDANSITWLTRVHTLANAIDDIDEAELRAKKDRHILTRFFRSGRKCDPEVTQISSDRGNGLIVSTDGFWADLDEENKAAFVDGVFKLSGSISDDASCLILKNVSGGAIVGQERESEGEENFYLIRNGR